MNYTTIFLCIMVQLEKEGYDYYEEEKGNYIHSGYLNYDRN